MLMYGNYDNYLYINHDNCFAFNITSLKEGFVSLSYLIPPNNMGHLDGRDFDISYANYIMSNDIVFKQFFDIVYSLYIGKDVYLLINESDWSENIIESILKLIQQRYGYNAIKINCFDDYVFGSNNAQLSSFNPYYGIKNLDIDKERYSYIIESERIKNGGKVIIDDE